MDEGSRPWATKRLALLKASELGVGEVKPCVVPGLRPLAIYNIQGEFFITDDTCTHGRGSLAAGFLHGTIIECPLHGGTFDVRTGRPASRPCVVALRTYRAVVLEGTVFVELTEPNAPEQQRAGQCSL